MFYRCSICLLPNTKPDLSFNENKVCSACLAFSQRPAIDWHERDKQFREILENHKGESQWDCIVPVSGGKDSTAQVLKVLSLGAKPLCVSARTCDLTPLGRRNLDNIGMLGVDLIELNADRKVRARINRFALELVGDISWPEHVAIFTGPVQVAVNFKVPLIVWGENSQNEYGGPASSQDSPYLNRSWLEEFGGLLGLRVSDLVETGEFTTGDLAFYQYPEDEDLERVGVTGVFLGHYYPWDGLGNALVASAYGFEMEPQATQGSVVGYENLDNFQAGIHEYFKYLKFGFGRATDILSSHIRRGRISREAAIEVVIERDGAFPNRYLGKDIVEVLGPLGLTVEEFKDIAESHTSRELFQTDSAGSLIYDGLGRPILLEQGF